MPSLQARLMLAASLVLAAFLGLGGLALDRSFRDSAQTAVRQRLQTDVYALLAAADVSDNGTLVMPARLPDARLERPGSGLYAQVAGADGGVLWRAPSELGQQLPATGVLPVGSWHFSRSTGPAGSLFVLGFGLAWDTGAGSRQYTFTVLESTDAYAAQVARFRRSLLLWLGGAAGVLLLVQGAILRWSLAPLRRAATDLAAVQAGTQERLAGRYPRELHGLTDNLNALLESERRQLGRYRDGLADLAHSLKTPLAVLRGAVTPGHVEADLAALVREQAERMGGIVDYQLQRAATSGRTALMAPVAVAPVVQRVVASLDKVHRDKGVRTELAIDADVVFRGDQGDLLELTGNLLDNAYKWCGRRVRVTASRTPSGGLLLAVEDDGPGVPEAQVRAVLERGIRADSTVTGHGIGLAVVRDIAGAYRGGVTITRSELGGARVQVELAAG